MDVIELSSRTPNLEKFSSHGNESTIYIDEDKLYKIFNKNVNTSLKRQSIELVYSKRESLSGIILPVEELSFDDEIIGHTMWKYDIKTIDNFFDIRISYKTRYDYCLKFISLFNRINNLGLDYTDFHTDNIFIDSSGNPLLGDCSCIRENVSIHFKKEQLSLLLSLLSGVNLVSESNNDFCIGEIIEQCGNNNLLNYFYNPRDNLDISVFDNFCEDKEKVDSIVLKYGRL